MRYLFGFLRIFVFLLLPFIACGDWLEGPDSPCEGVNCNDGNPCTDDSCTHDCSSPTCVHDPVANGTGCSLRGASGACVNGVCDLCAGVVCEDDGNECIDDVCRAYTGTCGVRADNGTPCKYKGLFAGVCVSGFCAKNLCEDGVCNDGNECTDDTCDSTAGTCNYIPLEDYTRCDFDGLAGLCLDGLCEEDLCEGVVCDDDNACTDGSCDYVDGTCDFIAVENGTTCNFDGARSVCISGVCQPQCESPEDCDDRNECTQDLCADSMCEFAPVTDGTACDDDGNECTADMCANGRCEATPVEDGTACRDGASACRAGSCVSLCTEQGIRDAIAEGGGPHFFACDGPTTVVTEGEIVIDNDVILDGVGNLTVDAGGTHRVFSVAANITTELRGMAITGGASETNGGGIQNAGVLTVTNSTVSGNTANGAGGGIYSRYDFSVLTVTNSTVSGNDARGGSSGGGIYNAGTGAVTNSTVSDNFANQGGGIFQIGNMTLTNITVSDNFANEGGGIYFGGSLEDSVRTLKNSIVSNNAASDYGGGILNHGLLTLANSTVSHNTARGGGGMDNTGALTLANSTISGNTAAVDWGSAILNRRDGTVAESMATLIDGECFATQGDFTLVSNGYNIESPGDTCGFDQSTDQVNVSAEDLNLGPLQDNGGDTETHSLGAGSVAIDQIPQAACVDANGVWLVTDQRGEPRPETGGSMCDIGAFEVQP